MRKSLYIAALVFVTAGVLLLLIISVGPMLTRSLGRQDTASTKPPIQALKAASDQYSGKADTEKDAQPQEPSEATKPPAETQAPLVPAWPEEQIPYSDRFKQIKQGMTLYQVNAVMGVYGSVVSSSSTGMTLIRWANPDGSNFSAKFQYGLLSRTTGLHYPGAKPKEPSQESEAPAADEEVPRDTSQDGQEDPLQAESAASGEYAQDYTHLEPDQPIPGADELTAQEPAQDVPPRQTRVVGLRQQDGARVGRTYRKPRLPRYVTSVKRGPHDVHIFNDNDFTAKIGLRSGKYGKDFTLSPRARTSLFVENGKYTLYYLAENDPDTLHNAGTFAVNSPTEPIFIHLRD